MNSRQPHHLLLVWDGCGDHNLPCINTPITVQFECNLPGEGMVSVTSRFYKSQWRNWFLAIFILCLSLFKKWRPLLFTLCLILMKSLKRFSIIVHNQGNHLNIIIFVLCNHSTKKLNVPMTFSSLFHAILLQKTRKLILFM